MSDFQKLQGIIREKKGKRKLKIIKSLNNVLVIAWKKADDINQKRFIEDLVIKANEPFLNKMYKNMDHTFSKEDRMDYYQRLREPMVKSLTNFDFSYNVHFLTYHAYQIKGARSLFYSKLRRRRIMKERVQNEFNGFNENNVKEEELNKFKKYLRISKSLSEFEKQILHKYYVDGMKLIEVGHQLKRSHESIRINRDIALKKIKDELDELGIKKI